MTPLKLSVSNNPMVLQNRQNIMNSVEDKQFFEDLENIQSANKFMHQNMLSGQSKKDKSTAKKKVKKSAIKNDKISQHANCALSFKSMTSYILGDLDISGTDKEDEESEFASSFEISSNSSNKKSQTSMVRSNSISGAKGNQIKKFKEDRISDEE